MFKSNLEINIVTCVNQVNTINNTYFVSIINHKKVAHADVSGENFHPLKLFCYISKLINIYKLATN